MDKRISIIVPVYNCAAFLKACVASVLKQTYGNFELLLISDGSSDGSEELCRRFVCKDSRIRFFSQAHKGVSAARNLGLQEAEGEYLFFLDSDDAIHPQLLEMLMRTRERTKAVIISENFCRMSSEYFDRRLFRLSASGIRCSEAEYQYLDSEKALGYLIGDCLQGRLYAIGGKLIEKRAARKIRFDELLISGEDTKYMYQLLAEGADVAVLNGKQYYYRKHRRSRSAERTVEICRSIYASDKYIFLQEKEKGREKSARRREEKIVRKIVAWHAAAHRRDDAFLLQYTYRLLRKELGCLAEAGGIDPRTKLEYGLAFHCWPIYRLRSMIFDFLGNIF